jgi:ketosteroid isomerase-like protein
MTMQVQNDLGVRRSGWQYQWIFYVVLALFAGLLTFAGARAQQLASDDATFRKLTNDFCAAWSSGNTANVAKFYAHDDGLVFYDLAPFSYHGWKEYEAGVKKEFLESSESISLTAGKDLKVTRRGNIAWTTVPMHLTDKTKEGKTIELDARYTGIWEKRGKNWVLVHDHLSAVWGG